MRQMGERPARGVQGFAIGLLVLCQVPEPIQALRLAPQATLNTSDPSLDRRREHFFRIRLEPSAQRRMAELGIEAPVTGRVFVILSRDLSAEPRLAVGVSGNPVWGRDVESLSDMPVDVVPGTQGVRGYPLQSTADVPAGRYRVQAFLSAYTRYSRADGHTLWLHHDRGEGQDLWRSPGNVHSVAATIDFDPASPRLYELVLDQVIPPVEPVPPDGVLDQGNPVDSTHVKFVKLRSERLSRFWGRPMYLGANVLLPRDYARAGTARYPTIYLQGHFPGGRAPFGYAEGDQSRSSGTPGTGRGADAFSNFWRADQSPRVVVVTIRDANPYYDTSYSVNSPNLGPYGDAITQELIPYLEQQFRLVPEPWARVLAGGSTGGWEAMAMQLLYPTLFGGVWSWCPDSLDFRHHQVVNIYDDDNAYEARAGWQRVERPNTRGVDGNVLTTIRQENAFEAAVGPHHRSGGQWAVWEAVFGPTGEDGYPQPLWNPDSGAIDRRVARAWAERYDLSLLIQREWPRLTRFLTGRLHVAVGDMDTYFLEQGVYAFEDRVRGLTPPARATFEYGRRKPHCWTGASPADPSRDLSDREFVERAAKFMADQAPVGSALGWAAQSR